MDSRTFTAGYTSEKTKDGWVVTYQSPDQRRKPTVLGTFEKAQDAAAAALLHQRINAGDNTP